MSLRMQSTLVASLSLFFNFSVAQVFVGLRRQINNFVFPTWACAAGFNNNNNSSKINSGFMSSLGYSSYLQNVQSASLISKKEVFDILQLS